MKTFEKAGVWGAQPPRISGGGFGGGRKPSPEQKEWKILTFQKSLKIPNNPQKSLKVPKQKIPPKTIEIPKTPQTSLNIPPNLKKTLNIPNNILKILKIP